MNITDYPLHTELFFMGVSLSDISVLHALTCKESAATWQQRDPIVVPLVLAMLLYWGIPDPFLLSEILYASVCEMETRTLPYLLT